MVVVTGRFAHKSFRLHRGGEKNVAICYESRDDDDGDDDDDDDDDDVDDDDDNI